MKKNRFVFGMAVFVAALFFTACPNPTEPEETNNYTVTIDPGLENGSITAVPTNGAAGTEITLTITPDNGYVLKDRSLKYTYGNTTVSIEGTRFNLPAANVMVTATFDQALKHIVTKPSNDYGSIEAPDEAPAGTPIAIRANPLVGYKLTWLKANGKVINISLPAPWIFTVTEDVTLTAEFEAVEAGTYTVTIDPGLENGSIAVNPQYGASGIPIALTVTPDAGYKLKAESLKYTYSDDIEQDITELQFNLPVAHVTVTAEFEKVEVGTYTVSIATLQHGSIAAAPQTGAEGESITLTVKPADGYKLKSGSLKYIQGSATVPITGTQFNLPAENVTVSAEFEAIPYTVSIAALQHGSIAANPQSGATGTEITLTVNPDVGYVLKSLEYTNNSDDTKHTITGIQFILPPANVTVSAVFETVPINNYTVTIDAAIQHGSVTAEPQYGTVGTPITLTVTPDAGYVLKSLEYTDNAKHPLTETQFNLPAANVTVSAVFVEKSSAQFVDAGVDALVDRKFNDAIAAFESAYQKDKNNNEALVYSSLARLASIATDQNVQNLVSNRLGFIGYPGTIDALLTTGWMQTYTNEEIIYGYYDESNGKFYEWRDPQNEWDAKFFSRYGLLLKAGYYYSQDLSNPEYNFVSPDRKNGELDWYFDDTRKVWLYWYDNDPSDKGRSPGYYRYSSTYVLVNGRESPKWSEDYYDEDLGLWLYWYDNDPSDEGRGPGYYYFYSDYLFEDTRRKYGALDEYYNDNLGVWVHWEASAPDYGDGWTIPGYYWVKYSTYHLGIEKPQYNRWTEKMPGLSEPGWFKESGAYKDNLTSAGALQAYQWPLLFYANLVDKNQDGLNGLLDDVLSSVFGAAFEDAAGRYAGLTASVVVDAELIEAFGLKDILGEEAVYIGKAELDLLFSALRLFKASLEWVAAYDWNTDVSFLKTDWEKIAGISDLSPKNLPFGNGFMKDRGNGMMTKSKADFDKALGDSIGAYDHLISDQSGLPPAYSDEMKNYRWLRDGLSQLRTAIQNRGDFYVPKDAPSGDSYNNSSANAIFGINLGKLFTPGQFAINQLVETESDGKAPRFYAFNSETPTAITNKAAMDGLEEDCYIGFKIILDPIKKVLVKGQDEFGLGGETLYMPLFPKVVGKDLYGLYHK